MTLTQLKQILACEATGSISKAAQQEYTSISNLSKSLKSLENELGFQIFIRNNNGIVPTERGKALLLHAHSIMNELHQIKHMTQVSQPCRFSVACHQANPYASSAFVSLCNEYQHESSLKLSLYRANFPECVERVFKQQSDLAIVHEHFRENIADSINQRDLIAKSLGNLIPNIYLRKGHPALQDYQKDTPFFYITLHRYPYIDYVKDNQIDYFPTYRTFGTDAINLSKVILVNSPSMRVKIAKCTDAFFIGIENANNESDELFRIPLPNQLTTVYCIYSRERPLSKIAQRYIELLQREMQLSESN